MNYKGNDNRNRNNNKNTITKIRIFTKIGTITVT